MAGEIEKTEKTEKKIEKPRGNNGGARPGAGRKPRGPGKVTYDLKLVAQDFSEAGLKKLVEIMNHKDTSNADKLKAIGMLWDRAHGKPVQAIEGTGENGEIVVTFRR